MPYYNICPNCGCSLDPCETCDCQKNRVDKNQYNAAAAEPQKHLAETIEGERAKKIF